MSLSSTDFQEIRQIVKEEIAPIFNELHTIRNDIKEIYDIIFELQ